MAGTSKKGYERGWPEQRDGWRSSRMEEEVSNNGGPWRARMNSRASRQKEKKKKKKKKKNRIPLTKPLLNKKQRKKRHDWARAHQHWTVEQWGCIIFRINQNSVFHSEIKAAECGARLECKNPRLLEDVIEN